MRGFPGAELRGPGATGLAASGGLPLLPAEALKAFYVEISRARDRAELVTDDAAALKERLEAVTGERISALEGIGESVQREHGKEPNAALDKGRPEAGSTAPSSPDREIGRESPERKAPEPEPPARGKGIEMDMGL